MFSLDVLLTLKLILGYFSYSSSWVFLHFLGSEITNVSSLPVNQQDVCCIRCGSIRVLSLAARSVPWTESL